MHLEIKITRTKNIKTQNHNQNKQYTTKILLNKYAYLHCIKLPHTQTLLALKQDKSKMKKLAKCSFTLKRMWHPYQVISIMNEVNEIIVQ